jgi:hypothetical protein
MNPLAPRHRRAQPAGTALHGLFAVLLLCAPVALPEATLHEHARGPAACATGVQAKGAPGACDRGATEARALDLPYPGREASHSLSTPSGLCFACAQYSGKAQTGLAGAGIATVNGVARFLHTASDAFDPDNLAAGGSAPRAPPHA